MERHKLVSVPLTESVHWLPCGNTNFAGNPRNSLIRTHDDQVITQISKNNKSMHAVCHLRDIDDASSKLRSTR